MEALVVIDVQNEFSPTGAPAVEGHAAALEEIVGHWRSWRRWEWLFGGRSDSSRARPNARAESAHAQAAGPALRRRVESSSDDAGSAHARARADGAQSRACCARATPERCRSHEVVVARRRATSVVVEAPPDLPARPWNRTASDSSRIGSAGRIRRHSSTASFIFDERREERNPRNPQTFGLSVAREYVVPS